MFREIRILLVEDDEVEVEHIVRSFRQRHFTSQVICVNEANEALKLLRGQEGHSPLPRPYVILLDLHLPGISGLEFLQSLRQDAQLKASTVFLLTASASEQEVRKAYGLGVAGFILKDKAGEYYQHLIQMLECYLMLVSPFNNYLFLDGTPPQEAVTAPLMLSQQQLQQNFVGIS
ncbi:MAG: response regulator [Caldilineaceae bacterium]